MPTVWDHPDQEAAAVAAVAVGRREGSAGQLQAAMQVHRASGASVALHRASGGATAAAAADSPRVAAARTGGRQMLGGNRLRRNTMEMPW